MMFKMTSSTKYPAILFISKLVRFFAWSSLILTVIVLVMLFQAETRLGISTIQALVGVGVIGGFFTLALFAIAEILIVLIDIEFNTRKSVESGKNKLISDTQQNPVAPQSIENKGQLAAIEKIRKHGISVQVVEVEDGENRYVIVKGTSVKQINKNSELIKYADDLN